MPAQKKGIHWWNHELFTRKTKVRKLFTGTGGWDKYKVAFRNYGCVLRKAKQACQSKYCTKIEITTECDRFEKVLQKEYQGQLGTLKRPDGKYIGNTGDKSPELVADALT